MKKLRSLTAALACLGALSFATPASSALVWDWSFKNGAETGTFETNGTAADTAGPFNFIIDINSFAVTASAFAPAIVGASFYQTMPSQGFLWNGSAPTQFYRSSGSYTNGSNFQASGLNYRLTFGVSGTSLIASTQNTITYSSNGFTALTLALHPVSASSGSGSVPEPATLSLFALGAAGFAASRRRKAA